MRGKHDKEIAAALGSVSSTGSGIYAAMKAPKGEKFDSGINTAAGSLLGTIGGGMVGHGAGSALALVLRKNPAALRGIMSGLGIMGGGAIGAHVMTKNRKDDILGKLGLSS